MNQFEMLDKSVAASVRDARFMMGTLIELIAFIDTSLQISPRDKEPSTTLSTTQAIRSILHNTFIKFEHLEQLCNIFDPDSELSFINRNAYRSSIKVSGQLFEIISSACHYTIASQHLFSMLLGPLSAQWRAASVQDRLPGPLAIKLGRLLANIELITLNADEQTIFFKLPGVQIDLGGFVKGYAVDQARLMMQSQGIKSAVINAGNSSISVWHHLNNDYRHRLGVRQIGSEVGNEEAIIGVLSLKDGAISTSGTDERGFYIKECYYSHLIDSRKGQPLTGLKSATVLSTSATQFVPQAITQSVSQAATQAEVISKMVILAGKNRALDICEAQGWTVDGLIHQQVDRAGKLHIIQSFDLPFELISK